MFKLENQGWKSYLAGVVALVSVTFFLLEIEKRHGEIPTAAPLLLPILISALTGGLIPGLVLTALSAITMMFLFDYDLSISLDQDIKNIIRFASIIVEGFVLSVFGEMLQMAKSYVRAADAKNLELQQAKLSLQQIDQKKNTFIATLAHELRNPLTPILTAAQMLRLDYNEEMSRWAGGVIEEQVNHLMGIVNDLLDVTRLTQGKMKLKEEKLVLDNIISQATDIAREELIQRKQRLNIKPYPPIRLNGDGQRLVQVFSNLLLNASKFTPEGGRIDVKVKVQSSMAVVTVRDNGIGIPGDMLEGIFEPFVQIGKPDVGGLGIGLALVRNLVELHGGNVSVTSGGANRGSEFTVRLPCLPGKMRQRQVSNLAEEIGEVELKRILVVDDNPAVTASLAKLLEKVGMQVYTADSGNAAIEMASRYHPDVLLLDIGMPDKDGYEVLHELKDSGKLEDSLQIAMTGYGGHQRDERYALQQGFHYYLNKPIDIRKLLSILGNTELESRATAEGL